MKEALKKKLVLKRSTVSNLSVIRGGGEIPMTDGCTYGCPTDDCPPDSRGGGACDPTLWD